MRNAKEFKAAILVASDRSAQGTRPDQSGLALRSRLEEIGIAVARLLIVADDRDEISRALRQWVADGIHLIVTSGGTGLSPRDVTPEATLSVIDRRAPGMEEAMRLAAMKFTPFGMLSRGVVGVARTTLIVNLPGNPKGALENLAAIEPALIHALELIGGGKPDP